MRKAVFVAVAALAALAVTGVAFAVTNTYTVSSTVSPQKAGTKKKPVPIGLNFNYTVGEAANMRPGTIARYTIGFGGIRANGGAFPKCTAAAINAAGNDSACPAGSVVGKGQVNNLAGPTADPTNKSLKCYLDLKIYNSGAGKAALYLHGGPSGFVQPCVIAISQAIDASYVSGPDGGTALQFTVPAALLHPIGGVDNAVVQVASSIDKKTIKKGKGKKAKTIGYYESIGGCKGGKRTVSVQFTTEQGQSTSTGTKVTCKK